MIPSRGLSVASILISSKTIFSINRQSQAINKNICFMIYSAHPCQVTVKFHMVALHEERRYRDNLGNVHFVPKLIYIS